MTWCRMYGVIDYVYIFLPHMPHIFVAAFLIQRGHCVFISLYVIQFVIAFFDIIIKILYV